MCRRSARLLTCQLRERLITKRRARHDELRQLRALLLRWWTRLPRLEQNKIQSGKCLLGFQKPNCVHLFASLCNIKRVQRVAGGQGGRKMFSLSRFQVFQKDTVKEELADLAKCRRAWLTSTLLLQTVQSILPGPIQETMRLEPALRPSMQRQLSIAVLVVLLLSSSVRCACNPDAVIEGTCQKNAAAGSSDRDYARDVIVFGADRRDRLPLVSLLLVQATIARALSSAMMPCLRSALPSPSSLPQGSQTPDPPGHPGSVLVLMFSA